MDKDRFDKSKDIAQILSLIAVPLLIAWFGWNIQSATKEREIRRDYVQIAISILSNNGANADLRKWAVRVLRENSPTPFSESLSLALADGVASLGTPFTPQSGRVGLAQALQAPHVAASPEVVNHNLDKWQGELAVAAANGKKLDPALAKVFADQMSEYAALAEHAREDAAKLEYLQRLAEDAAPLAKRQADPAPGMPDTASAPVQPAPR